MDSQKENKKKKDATLVASTVMHIFTDYGNSSFSKYINVSYVNLWGLAPVALTVMQQPDELCLHRLPGASPGWGAPFSDNSKLTRKT